MRKFWKMEKSIAGPSGKDIFYVINDKEPQNLFYNEEMYRSLELLKLLNNYEQQLDSLRHALKIKENPFDLNEDKKSQYGCNSCKSVFYFKSDYFLVSCPICYADDIEKTAKEDYL